MAAENDLKKLIERCEQVIPYVTATLGRSNGFAIHKMEGYGDPKDWRAVHAGRAGSSERQLDLLLAEAHEAKKRLPGGDTALDHLRRLVDIARHTTAADEEPTRAEILAAQDFLDRNP